MAVVSVLFGPLTASAQTQPALNANTTFLTTSNVAYSDNGTPLQVVWVPGTGISVIRTFVF
jgi:hypothetical protein